jgi:hypothetical protein|tara:strand:- start:290 stop:832 length:543 start_codon:yes stop_codon:yes gene_type:complete
MKKTYYNISDKRALVNFERKISGILKNSAIPIIRDAIGEELEREIKSNIRLQKYDTLNPNFKVIGIMDTKDYLKSIQRRKPAKNRSIIFTKDPKAIPLEFGSKGIENAGLKDETMIAWSKRKGIPNPQIAGKRIAAKIRKEGTVEKPHWRHAVGYVKSRTEDIINETKKNLKEKLGVKLR